MSKIKEKQMKKRSMIIETAISLMNDTPFEELSVNDICDAAGISTGTFYHYFEKKSDISVGLLSLVDEYLEENVFPYLTNENEIDNLLMIANGFASHVEENGLMRSWLVTVEELSDYSMSGAKREIQIKLEEVISRGQENGQITVNHSAEELTRYFLISLRGVAADWTRRNGSYSITECMDGYISLFLKAFAA